MSEFSMCFKRIDKSDLNNTKLNYNFVVTG